MFAVAYSATRMVLVAAIEWGPLLAIREATARAAGWLVRPFVESVAISGCSIVAGDSVTTVSETCFPVSWLALGIALVLASGRIRPAAKLLWCAVMVPFVLVLNVPRVAVVALLAERHSVLLEPVHRGILPAAGALATVLIWLLAERLDSR